MGDTTYSHAEVTHGGDWLGYIQYGIDLGEKVIPLARPLDYMPWLRGDCKWKARREDEWATPRMVWRTVGPWQEAEK